jgi:hypothetical protein
MFEHRGNLSIVSERINTPINYITLYNGVEDLNTKYYPVYNIPERD